MNVKPVPVGTGVLKVGVNALPAVAAPTIVAEPFMYPARTVVTVTVALWPTVRPLIVSGSVDPEATPTVTMPAVVVVDQVYDGS